MMTINVNIVVLIVIAIVANALWLFYRNTKYKLEQSNEVLEAVVESLNFMAAYIGEDKMAEIVAAAELELANAEAEEGSEKE